MPDEEKKSCCAYRSEVPGSCHSRCNFNWGKSEHSQPKGDLHGIQSGWYMFPLNYDPVWMVEPCKEYSTEKNPKMVEKDDPLKNVISILGSR